MSDKQRILFLFAGNTCRSLMSEGYTSYRNDELLSAESISSLPNRLSPNTPDVMMGGVIGISSLRTNSARESRVQRFDYGITLCNDSTKQVCPVFFATLREESDWTFSYPIKVLGPQEESMKRVTQVGGRYKKEDRLCQVSGGVDIE